MGPAEKLASCMLSSKHCAINRLAMQEHHLSRELEMMLERLESPAWNLAPHIEQPHTVSTAATRVPAAYQPKVRILRTDSIALLEQSDFLVV